MCLGSEIIILTYSYKIDEGRSERRVDAKLY